MPLAGGEHASGSESAFRDLDLNALLPIGWNARHGRSCGKPNERLILRGLRRTKRYPVLRGVMNAEASGPGRTTDTCVRQDHDPLPNQYGMSPFDFDSPIEVGTRCTGSYGARSAFAN